MSFIEQATAAQKSRKTGNDVGLTTVSRYGAMDATGLKLGYPSKGISVVGTSPGAPTGLIELVPNLAFTNFGAGNIYIAAPSITEGVFCSSEPLKPISAEYASAWAKEFGRLKHVCLYRDGSVGSPPRELNWLKLLSQKPANRSVLVGLLDSINQLIIDKSFHQLSLVLASIGGGAETTEALVAVARYTAPARAQLPAWRSYVRRVRAELTKRGEDVEALMVGLPA